MATGVISWSQTAATNATADSTVNWAEGMAPSAVNDSGRALMASVAKYRDDTSGSLTTGGTSTAYTLTTNQGFVFLSEMNDKEIAVRFHAANGASPTLNVDGLGAKPIQIDADTAVPTGCITADSIWRLTYDNSIPAFIVNSYPQQLDALTVGTLTVTTISGTINLSNDFSVGTDKFTVAASTGNTVVAGTLSSTGNLAVNTNKFNVTASNGNTALAGTFAVTGATTLLGRLTANNGSGILSLNTAKSYIVFTMDGSGNITSSSSKRFNVASITRDGGTGLYTLTFTDEMPTANYIVIATAWNGNEPVGVQTITRSTTSLTFHTRSVDGNTTLITFADIVVFGY